MMQVLGAWAGQQLPPARSDGVPRAVFLVSPEGFCLAEQSASDNHYMAMSSPVDPDRAMQQFLGLQRALSNAGIATLSFAGRRETPDAVFPNNVFATANGRLLIGAMRHPVRQRETAHPDIRRVLIDGFAYAPYELQAPGVVAELTGSLVIDRARAIGFCGLSERCNAAGANAMHKAFALQGSLVFELARGEYHTNVVLSALAGRALMLCGDGFALPAVAERMRMLYPHCIELESAERQAYAGNCIALARTQVWMSECAADSLQERSRARLQDAGFMIHSVPLDEIEKAGGSLRCMIGECY